MCLSFDTAPFYFQTRKDTYTIQFYTESDYFSAYYYVYLYSLISSLLVFELFFPTAILKTEHFDNKNNMEP